MPIGDDSVTRDVTATARCDVTRIINCNVTNENASTSDVSDNVAKVQNEQQTSSDAASDVDVVGVDASEVDSVEAAIDVDDVDVGVGVGVGSERSDSFEKVESEPKKNRK